MFIVVTQLKAMVSQETETTGSKTTNFISTDEETVLLLRIVLDYKIKKLAGAKDSETVRTKYEIITKKFIEAYPSEENSKEFPRSPNDFNMSVHKTKNNCSEN